MWKSELDLFIKAYHVETTSFLPIIVQPPDIKPSIHICVYLPTAGHERQFTEELSSLSSTIKELSTSYPNSPIYLRGDFNVSSKNKRRSELLDHFMELEIFARCIFLIKHTIISLAAEIATLILIG